MIASTDTALTLDISLEQMLRALLQLPVAEKIRIADQLRASAAAEKWRMLSNNLPNVADVSMEEIVAEVKLVRRARKRKK